jgi:uncharacterized HAD superfamily protein
MVVELETLGIDIDEVLADTLNSFLGFYNPRNETDFKRQEFYVYNDWGKIMGVSEQHAMSEFHEFMFSPGGLTIPIISGSQQAIASLRTRYQLVSPTYRSTCFEDITKKYLDSNFQRAISSVEFANHYSTNGGQKLSKADLARKMGFTRLVEDQIHAAIECAEVGVKVYLLKSPWNENVPLPTDLPIFGPFNNWPEITTELMRN